MQQFFVEVNPSLAVKKIIVKKHHTFEANSGILIHYLSTLNQSSVLISWATQSLLDEQPIVWNESSSTHLSFSSIRRGSRVRHLPLLSDPKPMLSEYIFCEALTAVKKVRQRSFINFLIFKIFLSFIGSLDRFCYKLSL